MKLIKTKVMLSHYIGDTCKKPIMGGVTTAQIINLEVVITHGVVDTTRITMEYHEGSSTRTSSYDSKVSAFEKLPREFEFGHRFAIGEEVLIICDYVTKGAMLVKTKISNIKLNIDSKKRTSISYFLRSGTWREEKELFINPEECINYLTRDLTLKN